MRDLGTLGGNGSSAKGLNDRGEIVGLSTDANAQPRPFIFDGAMRELQKIVPKSVSDPNFVTYYMLKTNFKPARDYDYPVLDLSFGGALILDIAGIQKDDFFSANALMRDRCHGFYLNCPDKPVLDAYQNFIFHDLGVLHE